MRTATSAIACAIADAPSRSSRRRVIAMAPACSGWPRSVTSRCAVPALPRRTPRRGPRTAPRALEPAPHVAQGIASHEEPRFLQPHGHQPARGAPGRGVERPVAAATRQRAPLRELVEPAQEPTLVDLYEVRTRCGLRLRQLDP